MNSEARRSGRRKVGGGLSGFFGLGKHAGRKEPHGRSLRIELLEDRSLLSGTATAAIISYAMGQSAMQVFSNAPYANWPVDLLPYYGLSNVLAYGQTIAIVAAYKDPTLATDAAAFGDNFGTGGGTLTIYDQNGKVGGAANTDPTGLYEQSEAAEVEWAAAAAPLVNIDMVEANDGTLANLMAAVNTARNLPGVSVVCMGFSVPESSLPASGAGSEASYDSTFTTPAGHIGVTFVAAAGDSGDIPQYPSCSPNVLSVGGTSLWITYDPYTGTDSYGVEAGWPAGGGGQSTLESKPGYQSKITSVSGTSITHRATPDVSLNADDDFTYTPYGPNVYFQARG